MADEYDYLFKSIVVGDGGVGKTALTLRFSKGFFTEDYKMTIGVDFHVKTIKIETEEEGTILVKLQIWDTGGQERFSSIRPMYYRGSLGALLIFDLTSYESFEHLPQWIEEVRANVKTEVPLLLLGNKSDLIDLRAVSIDEINDFTKKFNLYYMETSAKTGLGVGDCFYILACLMVGSGVPEQLVSQSIVFSPGQAEAAAPATAKVSVPQEQPVAEMTIPVLEPEPEIEFSAPPVPEPTPAIEPEPELEFAAPPVPEQSFKPAPTFEPAPVPKMEVPVKEDTGFEFKTPDQILTGGTKEEASSTIFSAGSMDSEVSVSPDYKPKSIPFATSIPVPAPAPEEFQDSEIASDSLVDYMPETILSKKDKKKLEKEKAKLEKERKLQEKKDKAAKMKEDMQRVGKEKAMEKEKAKLEKERLEKEKKEKERLEKEKKEREKKEKAKKEKVKKIVGEPPSPIPAVAQDESGTGATSFFQAISQKTTEPILDAPDSAFIPFMNAQKTESEETTKPMAIPNIADIISQPSQKTSAGATTSEAPSFPAFQPQPQKAKKKEIIICKQCGAMLSTDYMFCNKCGSKL